MRGANGGLTAVAVEQRSRNSALLINFPERKTVTDDSTLPEHMMGPTAVQALYAAASKAQAKKTADRQSAERRTKLYETYVNAIAVFVTGEPVYSMTEAPVEKAPPTPYGRYRSGSDSTILSVESQDFGANLTAHSSLPSRAPSRVPSRVPSREASLMSLSNTVEMKLSQLADSNPPPVMRGQMIRDFSPNSTAAQAAEMERLKTIDSKIKASLDSLDDIQRGGKSEFVLSTCKPDSSQTFSYEIARAKEYEILNAAVLMLGSPKVEAVPSHGFVFPPQAQAIKQDVLRELLSYLMLDVDNAQLKTVNKAFQKLCESLKSRLLFLNLEIDQEPCTIEKISSKLAEFINSEDYRALIAGSKEAQAMVDVLASRVCCEEARSHRQQCSGGISLKRVHELAASMQSSLAAGSVDPWTLAKAHYHEQQAQTAEAFVNLKQSIRQRLIREREKQFKNVQQRKCSPSSGAWSSARKMLYYTEILKEFDKQDRLSGILSVLQEAKKQPGFIATRNRLYCGKSNALKALNAGIDSVKNFLEDHPELDQQTDKRGRIVVHETVFYDEIINHPGDQVKAKQIKFSASQQPTPWFNFAAGQHLNPDVECVGGYYIQGPLRDLSPNASAFGR